MDAIDLNAGWLVGHEGCRLELNLPDQLPKDALVHCGYQKPQMIFSGWAGAGLENVQLMPALAAVITAPALISVAVHDCHSAPAGGCFKIGTGRAA